MSPEPPSSSQMDNCHTLESRPKKEKRERERERESERESERERERTSERERERDRNKKQKKKKRKKRQRQRPALTPSATSNPITAGGIKCTAKAHSLSLFRILRGLFLGVLPLYHTSCWNS